MRTCKDNILPHEQVYDANGGAFIEKYHSLFSQARAIFMQSLVTQITRWKVGQNKDTKTTTAGLSIVVGRVQSPPADLALISGIQIRIGIIAPAENIITRAVSR